PLLDADTSEVGSTPVYVNGQIWAAIPTAINAALSTAYDGVYWLDVAASGGVKSLSAKLTAQGFVAAPKGTSLLYPAIAMPTSGQGEIGVTLTGPYN
ncbi:hypothetical protein ACJENL_26745, partial [Escherichia coli]